MLTIFQDLSKKFIFRGKTPWKLHFYSNYDIQSGEDKAEAVKTKLKPSASANIRGLILDNSSKFASDEAPTKA